MNQIQDTPINEPLFVFMMGMYTSGAIFLSPPFSDLVSFLAYWIVIPIFFVLTWALAFK